MLSHVNAVRESFGPSTSSLRDSVAIDGLVIWRKIQKNELYYNLNISQLGSVPVLPCDDYYPRLLLRHRRTEGREK